jgi:hypothetical protein
MSKRQQRKQRREQLERFSNHASEYKAMVQANNSTVSANSIGEMAQSFSDTIKLGVPKEHVETIFHAKQDIPPRGKKLKRRSKGRPR